MLGAQPLNTYTSIVVENPRIRVEKKIVMNNNNVVAPLAKTNKDENLHKLCNIKIMFAVKPR